MSKPSLLTVSTPRVDALSDDDVAALYALFERYYERADPKRFREDLALKQWVILLRDKSTGAIGGFSTVRLLGPSDLERRCRVIYSGDTVVDERYWGGQGAAARVHPTDLPPAVEASDGPAVLAADHQGLQDLPAAYELLP